MVLSSDRRKELYGPFLEIMKDCRIDEGISQSRLARMAELSTKYVTLVESGRRVPTLEALIAIMAHAGVRRSVVQNLLNEVLDEFRWDDS
jgi:transcriptional regulator with XRE-family HTH domain